MRREALTISVLRLVMGTSHSTIYEQAAAYLYHLAMNHPFVDGNKRTAFAIMLTFLNLNGYNLNLSQEEAYNLVIRVVQREISKEELSAYLREYLQGT